MPADPILTSGQRDVLAAARRAVLATIAPDGRPRLVPICHVLDEAGPILYSPLDEKPKRAADPRTLARVRDLLRRSARDTAGRPWNEDWNDLAWLRCQGSASILEPGETTPRSMRAAVVALRAKYPQYATHDLETRPLIRITLERVTSWAASGAATG